MPVVVFESSVGRAVEADVAGGGYLLLDVCDDVGAPVPFSCRSASCGTCRVAILEGGDLLESPRADELEVLELFGDDPARCRLACQARLRDRVGRLRVRPVDDA
jgi:ferredoxin